MAKRRWLFRYLGVFPLLCLVSMIPTILSPNPCLGSESGEELATFSLEADQQALGEVLQQISEATGYEITIDSEYAKLPITVSLENVSVEEGLRRILGKLSRYMVIDEAEKKIYVRIVDTEAKKSKTIASREKVDPLDLEVIPPKSPGERGITQRELEESNKRQSTIDPGDLEVIPPDSPGGAGMTARELEALTRQQERNDDRTSILIPPDNVENSKEPEGGKPGDN